MMKTLVLISVIVIVGCSTPRQQEFKEIVCGDTYIEKQPIFVPRVNYPKVAFQQRVQGCAVVEITVTKFGTTSDIALIGESPQGFGFGRSAKLAASKLRYKPTFADGSLVEFKHVKYEFLFSLSREEKNIERQNRSLQRLNN